MQTARTLLLLPLVLFAEDWPEFRGPTGQGHSQERGLPLSWSESQGVKWKVPVPGRGWSSPAISGNRVWLTTATADGLTGIILRGRTLRALAYDRETGKEIINAEVFRLTDAGAMHAKNSHASPTPIIDGDRVYVHFGAHGTAALSTSGQVLWKITLPYSHQHGTGGSPVLYRDLLILSCDGTDVQYVAALEKATGKIRWKTSRPRPGAMAYSTPLIIRDGNRDLLISPGAFRTVAYEPLSGKEIWRAEYDDGFSNVPRPVYGHGLVFLATGFNEPGFMAVQAASGQTVWTMKRGAPLTPSPVLVGDELYLVNDGGIGTCVEAKTGKVHWQQRIGGNHSASPVYADGRIYFLNENGEATIIAPGKEFKKLASNRLDGQTLASIAVSSGSLFIRSEEHLYRIDAK